MCRETDRSYGLILLLNFPACKLTDRPTNWLAADTKKSHWIMTGWFWWAGKKRWWLWRRDGLLENMAQDTKLLVHHGMHNARCNEWLLRQAGKKNKRYYNLLFPDIMYKTVKYSCIADKIITQLMIISHSAGSLDLPWLQNALFQVIKAQY